MPGLGDRVLLHLADGLRRPVEPGEIYFLEAVGAETRVREIRRRPSGEDWELKLEPPVNRVLPVSRGRLEGVWEAFGEGR